MSLFDFVQTRTCYTASLYTWANIIERATSWDRYTLPSGTPKPIATTGFAVVLWRWTYLQCNVVAHECLLSVSRSSYEHAQYTKHSRVPAEAQLSSDSLIWEYFWQEGGFPKFCSCSAKHPYFTGNSSRDWSARSLFLRIKSVCWAYQRFLSGMRVRGYIWCKTEANFKFRLASRVSIIQSRLVLAEMAFTSLPDHTDFSVC